MKKIKKRSNNHNFARNNFTLTIIFAQNKKNNSFVMNIEY